MKLGLKPGQSRAERKQHFRDERDRLALEMFKVAIGTPPEEIINSLAPRDRYLHKLGTHATKIATYEVRAKVDKQATHVKSLVQAERLIAAGYRDVSALLLPYITRGEEVDISHPGTLNTINLLALRNSGQQDQILRSHRLTDDWFTLTNEGGLVAREGVNLKQVEGRGCPFAGKPVFNNFTEHVNNLYKTASEMGIREPTIQDRITRLFRTI